MDRTTRASAVLKQLEEQRNPENIAGMARFGIRGTNVLGISVSEIRRMAKPLGKDHELALDLWASGAHEARILASLIDDPSVVSMRQMNQWVAVIDSWDLCDQCCQNLFVRTDNVFEAIDSWCLQEPEMVKRAGFSLLASAAVRLKQVDDESLVRYLPVIADGAADGRNYAKKGVSWALRQLGKRSNFLFESAWLVATDLAESPDANCQWVGKDALRDLQKHADRLRSNS